MTRIRHQQTPTICCFSNFQQTFMQIEKSLKSKKEIRNHNYAILTATTSNGHELFHNFRKVLFYNQYFLLHAKITIYLLNILVVCKLE